MRNWGEKLGPVIDAADLQFRIGRVSTLLEQIEHLIERAGSPYIAEKAADMLQQTVDRLRGKSDEPAQDN